MCVCCDAASALARCERARSWWRGSVPALHCRLQSSRLGEDFSSSTCCTPRSCARGGGAGNSLDYTDKCLDIMTEHGAAVKEMEAAAIAWVAHLFSTPLICLKVRARWVGHLFGHLGGPRARLPHLFDACVGRSCTAVHRRTRHKHSTRPPQVLREGA